ncbi:hypothetical protein evm_012411 [Chilo suppressalis]|nr:hypothetical protein evm_012411 [Chilo suppressalis]
MVLWNDWSEKASSMTPNWSSLNGQEKPIKGQELTKKWKNIKDKYRKALKYIKNVKSGSAENKIKKTYTYFNLLHFLRPVLDENTLESNIPLENSSVSATDTENFEIQSAEPERIVERKNQSKRNSNDECEQELLDILRKRNSVDKRRLQDENVLFLLSLAPPLKKMTPLTKMRTEIEILISITNNMSESPDVQTNSYIFTPTTSSNGYTPKSNAPTTSQYENTTTTLTTYEPTPITMSNSNLQSTLSCYSEIDSIDTIIDDTLDTQHLF